GACRCVARWECKKSAHKLAWAELNPARGITDMQDVHLTRLDGNTITVAASAVEALVSMLRGRVLNTTAAEYDAARTIWNAMIDRRPGLIVRCQGVADVMHAVRFAQDHKALVAVRGGGHNIAGSALCDGGVVIDLSAMTSVRVDPVSRRAWVE